jgi:hypothetical protein
MEGDDDVEGHRLRRSDVAIAALAASTAVVAILNSAGGEATVHMAALIRSDRNLKHDIFPVAW